MSAMENDFLDRLKKLRMLQLLQMLKLPDGTVKVLVQGQQRAALERVENGKFFKSKFH